MHNFEYRKKIVFQSLAPNKNARERSKHDRYLQKETGRSYDIFNRF